MRFWAKNRFDLPFIWLILQNISTKTIYQIWWLRARKTAPGKEEIGEKMLQFLGMAVRIWAIRRPVKELLGGREAVQRLSLTGQGKWEMAEVSEKNDKGEETAVSKEVKDYVERLSDEHRMLVILKAQLYDGSWEPMLDDLKNRLAGKPYIFKLVNRINNDIARIEEMKKFEQEHNVDLADYVKM